MRQRSHSHELHACRRSKQQVEPHCGCCLSWSDGSVTASPYAETFSEPDDALIPSTLRRLPRPRRGPDLLRGTRRAARPDCRYLFARCAG
jgi:hypothetical protein